MREPKRTSRITIRCDSAELDGVDRLANLLDESRSAAVRRMIRAVTQHLDILSCLDTSAWEQEQHELQPAEETYQMSTAQGKGVQLVGALLTAYRDGKGDGRLLAVVPGQRAEVR